MWLPIVSLILVVQAVYTADTSAADNQNSRANSTALYQEKVKIVCYYRALSYNKRKPWNYDLADTPGDLCTDIIYAFAGLNNQTWELFSKYPKYDLEKGGYRKFTSVRDRYPHLKLLLSVGGWGEGGKKYSDMVGEKSRRDIFVKSAVKWVTDFGFDGLDLDWEYPGDAKRDGKDTDKENFLKLVEELKVAFEPHKLLLTCAGPISKSKLQKGYEVQRLAELFDWINVMAYGIRGNWAGFADGHSSPKKPPLNQKAYQKPSVVDGLKLWTELGAPKHKLVVGIPFFGKTYTLGGKDMTDLRAGNKAGLSGRNPVPLTNVSGYLAYYQICPHVKNGEWAKNYDDTCKCPYTYHDDQLIVYEDEESIGMKMDYIKEQGYGGAMVWAIDMDDFNGVCGRKNALLEEMNKISRV